MTKREVVMECEFKIKLNRDEDIKELCVLLDKWNKRSAEMEDSAK